MAGFLNPQTSEGIGQEAAGGVTTGAESAAACEQEEEVNPSTKTNQATDALEKGEGSKEIDSSSLVTVSDLEESGSETQRKAPLLCFHALNCRKEPRDPP